jgi:phosphoglycerate dehydrogenase-like enzyme
MDHGVVVGIPSRDTGNALACAEHALLLTLALLRDWNECQAAVRERRLGEPCGETLFGKSVLILGFGNIAKELVPRLKAFGVRMSCVRLSSWDDDNHSDEVRLWFAQRQFDVVCILEVSSSQ